MAFIEQPAVIEKILRHLGLWPAPAHSPPAAARPVPLSLQRVVAASPARHTAREVGRRAWRRHGDRGPPADRRLPIWVPPACVSLPLTTVAGAPDTPPDPGACYGGTREAGVGRSRWLPPGSRRGPRLDRPGAPKSKFLSPPLAVSSVPTGALRASTTFCQGIADLRCLAAHRRRMEASEACKPHPPAGVGYVPGSEGLGEVGRGVRSLLRTSRRHRRRADRRRLPGPPMNGERCLRRGP